MSGRISAWVALVAVLAACEGGGTRSLLPGDAATADLGIPADDTATGGPDGAIAPNDLAGPELAEPPDVPALPDVPAPSDTPVPFDQAQPPPDLADLVGPEDTSDLSGPDTDDVPEDVALDITLDITLDIDSAACPTAPGPADYLRRVVVAHPYAADGSQAGAYEVLTLDCDGVLARTGATFEMTRAFQGAIAFTADGHTGLVAHDDGTLGVFRLDDDGAVTVLHTAYEGSFYASQVQMAADGAHAYVLDYGWREHGGGIYRLAVGADGTVTDEGLVAPAKLVGGFRELYGRGDRALVVADDVLDSGPAAEAHLTAWTQTPRWLAGAKIFPDDEAMITAVGLTADDRHALLGDGCGFCEGPNRVVVAALGDDTVHAAQLLTPLNDPVVILASPWNDAAAVVSGYDNAVYVLGYDPDDPSAPFTNPSEPDYVTGAPALPGSAVLLTRGRLEGWFLVSENVGVHLFRFDGAGGVQDEGYLGFGSGYDNIAGAIGVQP